MAIGSTMSRIGRVDFFAILAPGFYIFCTVALTVVALSDDGAAGSIWVPVDKVVDNLKDWPYAVLTLFASYLLGSMLRAFSVDLADWFSLIFGRCVPERLRTRLPTPKFMKKWKDQMDALYTQDFPYGGALYLDLRAITQGIQRPGQTLDEAVAQRLKRLDISENMEGVGGAEFNHWKAVLCLEAPEGFALAQTLEARTRMFAGMFWANCVGTACHMLTLSFSCISWSTRGHWTTPASLLLGLSVLLTYYFGWRLRFVRGEEARRVFIIYVAHRERRLRE